MLLTAVAHNDVTRTDNLFQSGFWADFRASSGIESRCFTVSDGKREFCLVVLLRAGSSGVRYAYVPRGPAIELGDDSPGCFLEELSEALRAELPPDTACIRYDTVFLSPYTDGDYWTASGQWKGAPRSGLRELRMNYGTQYRALRKAPLDHFSPDTVIVRVDETDEVLLSRMRQTARNCLRRSWKSGLRITSGGAKDLPVWYQLYAETARRKKIYYEQSDYFTRLFERAGEYDGLSKPDLLVLTAWKDERALAGLVLAVSARRGYYLYAGSSIENRECMPNYGLQWEAMRILRERGCRDYDLMGVPPNGDPNHSMYGLYTFKTGLGGTVVHYSGCWDYPLDKDRYSRFSNGENLVAR